MLELHQVVKHCDVSWLVFVVERVALHNILVIVPLFVLADQLAALDVVADRVIVGPSVAGVDVRNPSVKARDRSPVGILMISSIC